MYQERHTRLTSQQLRLQYEIADVLKSGEERTLASTLPFYAIISGSLENDVFERVGLLLQHAELWDDLIPDVHKSLENAGYAFTLLVGLGSLFESLLRSRRCRQPQKTFSVDLDGRLRPATHNLVAETLGETFGNNR